MGTFAYVALDTAGNARKGVSTSDTPRQLRTELRRQGLYPITVEPLADKGGPRARRDRRQRVPAADLAAATRQLATLLRAGIPLEEALRVMERQLRQSRVRAVLAGVRERISEGVALHAAMAAYPAAFPELYRAIVEAGEAGGRLEEVLDRLADYTETRRMLQQKVAMALIYPAVVATVALAVVGVLLTYVVPEVIRVFEQSGQSLPLLTRGLIAASAFVREDGWLAVLILAAVVALARLWLRRPGVRALWHRAVLRVPHAQHLIRTADTARLVRTLAILTQSGVPLLEALAIGARTLRNLILRGIVREAADRVREGGRLHTALGAGDEFPPMLIHMLAAGEESGELEAMLAHIATQQERELETTITAFSAVLEPLIILVMGAIVLVIVLAILLPIFEMNQIIGA
jgi:general secretion pathway protein F